MHDIKTNQETLPKERFHNPLIKDTIKYFFVEPD